MAETGFFGLFFELFFSDNASQLENSFSSSIIYTNVMWLLNYISNDIGVQAV